MSSALRRLLPPLDQAIAALLDDLEATGLIDETLRRADLLVIGNRGLNTLAGRILGSVPLDVSRHSSVDVLIVHTT